jgi:protein-L-isoaspartate O-methyltransferase
MVTAAAEDDPKRLLSQLKPNGVLVAPVGKGPVQSLRRYAGDGKGGFRVESPVRRALRADAGRASPANSAGRRLRVPEATRDV